MSQHPINELADMQRPSNGNEYINEYGQKEQVPPVSLDGDLYGETTLLLNEAGSIQDQRLNEIMLLTAEIASSNELSNQDQEELTMLELERALIEADIIFKNECRAHPRAADALELWIVSQLDEYIRQHPNAEIDEEMRVEINLLASYLALHLHSSNPNEDSNGLIEVAEAWYKDLLVLYEELKSDPIDFEIRGLLAQRPMVRA